MGGSGVDAHGINDAVRTRAFGEFAQHFQRRFVAEVDRLCAMALGCFEPGGHLVDGEDAAGSEVLSAGNRHHADGTTAEDRNRVAGMNARHFRGLVRGRKNVAHHDGLIVRDLLREQHQVGGGIWHARVLGLKAIETAGCFRAAEEDCPARGPAGLMTLHWA